MNARASRRTAAIWLSRIGAVVGVSVALVVGAAHGAPLAQTPAAAGAPCAAGQLCGFNAPEDLVRVGDQVIASRLDGGGLNLVDIKARRVSLIDLALIPQAHDARYPCAALEADNFVSHGLNLKKNAAGETILYVVRHGKREAIEIFKLVARGRADSLQWIGCVPLPKGFAGNAVAGLRNGGFYVSSMTDDSDAPGASKLAKLYARQPSGAVLLWTPQGGYRHMPLGPISGPNGLELSPDERRLYVDDWAGGAIWAIDVSGSTAPKRLAVDFLPDNLRWADDGTLLAAGVRATPRATFECAMRDAPGTRCASRWAVLGFDPARMRPRFELRRDSRSGFGDVSTALKVGHALWLGSFDGETIGIEPLPRRSPTGLTRRR